MLKCYLLGEAVVREVFSEVLLLEEELEVEDVLLEELPDLLTVLALSLSLLVLRVEVPVVREPVLLVPRVEVPVVREVFEPVLLVPREEVPVVFEPVLLVPREEVPVVREVLLLVLFSTREEVPVEREVLVLLVPRETVPVEREVLLLREELFPRLLLPELREVLVDTVPALLRMPELTPVVPLEDCPCTA